MSQRRTQGSDNVQIRLNMRVLIWGGLVLAAIVVFGLAFTVGRLINQPAASSAPSAAAPGAASAPNSSLPAAPGQAPAQSAARPAQGIDKPSDTPVPVPLGRRPVGSEVAIGDNPRLAMPELKDSGYIYDFGEIGPQDKVEKTFIIRNEGTKPLEIKDVKSICGCTSSLVSNKTVPPGGETSLKIQFDAGFERIAGLRVTREVKVASNDPARPEISFHIAAYIRPQ
ncbi:MAG: DUF1573 domain-containing protein [Anaerolineae bacterium]|nr:DUF1573 domain-containing protein [Anaerolineae bacterium]